MSMTPEEAKRTRVETFGLTQEEFCIVLGLDRDMAYKLEGYEAGRLIPATFIRSVLTVLKNNPYLIFTFLAESRHGIGHERLTAILEKLRERMKNDWEVDRAKGRAYTDNIRTVVLEMDKHGKWVPENLPGCHPKIGE